jgi:hypothetical protein
VSAFCQTTGKAAFPIEARTPFARIGWWRPASSPPETDAAALRDALYRVNHPAYLLLKDNKPAIGLGGVGVLGENGATPQDDACAIIGYVPPCPLGWAAPIFASIIAFAFHIWPARWPMESHPSKSSRQWRARGCSPFSVRPA